MGTAQNQFDELWSAALRRCQLLTGTDLNTTKLPAAGNLEQFRQEVESSQSKFQEYRETRARLWRSLSAILGPIEVLGGVSAGGVSLVCPATPAIMGAISLLFQGAKGVSQAYNYIQELFDDMKAILARLQLHTQKQIPSELHLIFVDMLSCILEIIGVSTKYVSEGRAKLFLKRTFQLDDKAVVLKQQLTKLVDREVAMIAALNLDATSNILAQTVLTDCKIEGIAESIQQVAKRLEDSQGMKGDIDSATVLDKIRRILQPQLTVEDDLTRLEHIQDIHPIGYLFFKENDPLRVDLGIALKTAAYQLGSQKGTLSYLKYLNSICKDSDDFKTLAATWRNLFRVFIKGGVNERAFVVLDGVDEAIRDQLEPFLTLLREVQDTSPLSILLVSRPDIDWYIEEVFYETGSPPCVSINARKNTKDIEKYITSMLGKYRNLKKISKTLHKEIIDVFMEGAEGMFLWVDLMMKELSTRNRESAIRASLQNLPRGLSDTYRRMFQSFAVVLDEAEIGDLKELLNWVGFAERPLNLVELECLLALRSGDYGGVLDLYGEICKKYASFFTIVHQSYEEFRNPVKLGDKLNPDSTEKIGDIDEQDIKDDTHREPDPLPHQKLDMIIRLRHASLGNFLKSDVEGPKDMVIGLTPESA
ncbi:hypothetical protein H072_2611 [Dactylellina haptotyla CBS 200.50]|uniref:Uncharacterized protein n=1 Tax=Dactylellina haptotyla (strain CBS 200.50) TaxID=1284197 RepID=S8AKC8_DACHA|nr:hypothetical protein H072_2611 [Dactylellina haptotyla CBS 200.50]